MGQLCIIRYGKWKDAILDRVQTNWIDPDAEWRMICLLTDAIGFPWRPGAENDNASSKQPTTDRR